MLAARLSNAVRRHQAPKGVRGMAAWVQFERQGETSIGTLEGNTLTEYSGELLNDPVPSGNTFNLDDVKVIAPYQPRSIIALWNNFHERAKEEGQEIPKVPLYFMKPVSSVIGPGTDILRLSQQ